MTTWALFLGLCAIPVSVWRFQLPSRAALLWAGLPILVLVGSSYLLNHEPQGAVMVLASVTTGCVQAVLGLGRWSTTRSARVLRALLVVSAVTFGLWWAPPTTWQTGLPFLAYGVARSGEYALTPQIVRRFYVVSTILWGTYALSTGNGPIGIMELLTLASNLAWLVRNPIKKVVALSGVEPEPARAD